MNGDFTICNYTIFWKIFEIPKQKADIWYNEMGFPNLTIIFKNHMLRVIWFKDKMK
ncbi:MAG: hypothetical protein RBR32_03695 [Bacteroidales bacterium]|nr:hypothetical protein [Bacteroidales bacterium]